MGIEKHNELVKGKKGINGVSAAADDVEHLKSFLEAKYKQLERLGYDVEGRLDQSELRPYIDRQIGIQKFKVENKDFLNY
ncbi:hypothetical protein [Psychrilyobacter atlanticus]|uniref:hypothetical protein n=1 Tax=Psychrilyobacter atlanticus TaxID=271091 RepID=UPI00041C6556|nr:hypothetical protein [Psychrilyobacter atlanticus]